ncbi:carboxypeptidase regulatory-like domain-containing protein [Planctomicrobium sp. SH527]|uniref:carboxypeptidase regulatory-like domain-containing protein n=1 Tax=Planctomicrobium sp. SH527 TaxID=3448123 RepID=UPI003F5C3EF1
MVRFAWAAALVFALSGQSFAAGYGSVEGQFILDGDVPAATPLKKKGDTTIKDAATCAADDIPNEARAFDPKTKGIGNIVVYMRRAPANIHPDLKESKAKEVVFDQKNCRFLPHAMIVRTDQTVVCKSDDDVAHNVHTNPLANTSVNSMVMPKDRTGIKVQMPAAENIPVKVQCDIHPWMLSWWVVVDHPYAAITDSEGKFKIENLPEGEHEFRVWHESAGYINRKLTVKIKDGETTTLKVHKVPVKSFDDK